MPSSPTEARLLGLAHRYDSALEAVLRDELDRVQVLLAECEGEATSMPPPDLDLPAESEARDKVIRAHGRLLDALRQAKDATQRELQQIWKGKEILAGYGSRSEVRGTQVSTDA